MSVNARRNLCWHHSVRNGIAIEASERFPTRRPSNLHVGRVDDARGVDERDGVVVGDGPHPERPCPRRIGDSQTDLANGEREASMRDEAGGASLARRRAWRRAAVTCEGWGAPDTESRAARPRVASAARQLPTTTPRRVD